MKNVLLFVLAGFVSISSSCQVKNAGQISAREKPNIIFIMSDDHAYQTISAYDSDLIQTPNIDRIANEGALFKKTFVTNSLCGPSRAVLLSMKNPFVRQ